MMSTFDLETMRAHLLTEPYNKLPFNAIYDFGTHEPDNTWNKKVHRNRQCNSLVCVNRVLQAISTDTKQCPPYGPYNTCYYDAYFWHCCSVCTT